MSDSLEFRRLLGAFVSVCNAIAYAHSRGVIHRDLKPDNVVLGGGWLRRVLSARREHADGGCLGSSLRAPRLVVGRIGWRLADSTPVTPSARRLAACAVRTMAGRAEMMRSGGEATRGCGLATRRGSVKPGSGLVFDQLQVGTSTAA